MTVTEVVGYDAAAALVEHRRGWLPDLNGSPAFLYYAGDNHKEEICFKDGSRLQRDKDSSMPDDGRYCIYRVIAPDGRVLIEG